MTIAQEKTQLRKIMRQRRDAIEPKFKIIAAQLLSHKAAELAQYIAEKIGKQQNQQIFISAYYPILSEIDIFPLLTALESFGFALCLPVLKQKSDTELIFAQYSISAGDRLQNMLFGTKGPLDTAPHVRPDVILLPLLACDRFGNRLGYGRGYYDRTISNLRQLAVNPLLIGVCYDEQLQDRVVCDNFDVKLQAILTPSKLLTKLASDTESRRMVL